MQPKTMITLLVGSIFLGVSGLFVAVNLIQYQIGIDLPWNPFDKILDSTQGTPLRFVFDSVIIYALLSLWLSFFILTLRFVGNQARTKSPPLLFTKWEH